MPNPVNHRPLGLIVATVTLALDQLVKYTVTYPLALKSRMDEGIEILPIFRLRWLENRGVSMGFFHAETDVMRWLLVGMTMVIAARSEEHTSELQSLMRISYAVSCLNKKK